MNRLSLIALFSALTAFQAVTPAFALETAKVLPKGVRRVWLVGVYSNAVDRRYGDDGRLESVVDGFNKTLTMRDFQRSAPNLKTLVNYLNVTESGLGTELSALSNIYNDYSIRKQILIPSFQYGLTDRLTLGIRTEVTKRTVRNKINSESVSNANAVLARLGDKEAIPANLAAGLETLRQENLTPAFISSRMYDYKGYVSPRDFEATDLGDTEVGAKYLVYSDDIFDSAIQSRLIVPTGKERPINNPYDPGSGFGAWGATFELYQEASVTRWLTLNATVIGRHYFPDTKNRAVPLDEDDNLPSLRPEDGQVQSVRRRMGDELRTELATIFNIPGDLFKVWGAYQFWNKDADRFAGSGSLYYPGLSRDTGYKMHMWETGIRFSTISLFRQGKFQAPLEVDLLYNSTFAGRDIREASYGRLDLKLYF